jgi:hypothetical protein
MPIRFESIIPKTPPALPEFTPDAPDGAFLGILGATPAEIDALFAEAAPHAFTCANFSALPLAERLSWLHEATEAQRHGKLILAASAEPALLAPLIDELWWIHQGEFRLKGAPSDVIAAYTAHVFEELRARLAPSALHPSLKRGDGRAQVLAVEILDPSGRPTALVQSGQQATVRVRVRYNAAVESPVVGIMIRTRIGFEVYGTNTELERIVLGPVEAGAERVVRFQFACNLCPQSYTVTAASHDPNGVWHEWMEDAIAFAVAGDRYTAGVANLNASVSAE